MLGEAFAAGPELRHAGEARGGGSRRAIREHLANRLDAAGAENHVLCDREIEKIPLRDARAALFPPEGDLQESNVAFIALRSELIAEDGAHEFESLRLLSNAKKIDRKSTRLNSSHT